MKFLKKTAALLFCVALALSVMAVSAMAEGEVFTVTLAQASSDTHSNHNNVAAAEYLNADDVVYDIKLQATSGSYTVTALDFAIDLTSGTGLEVKSVTVGGQNITTSKNSSNKYTYSTYQSGGNTFTVGNSEPVTVGTVIFTVKAAANAAAGTTHTFSLTDITVKTNESDKTNGYYGTQLAATGATGTIEVDPEYTITVKKPVVNGTTGVIDSATTLAATVDATYTYTILTGTNGQTVVDGTDITAYTQGGTLYAVASESGAGNWETDDAVTTGKAFANTYQDTTDTENTTPVQGWRWGDVTLRPAYTANNYTLNFDLNDDGAAQATNSATFAEGKLVTTNTSYPDGVLTYTIEDAVTAGFFGTPTRSGYRFDGWVASSPSYNTDTDGSNTFWKTDKRYYAVPETSNDTAEGTVGAFGGVTLTAQWSMVGKFAEKNYKYAIATQSLMLFAVESPAAGVYYYNNVPMYIVDKAYCSMFAEGDGVTDSWTIYATIADANGAIGNVTFNPSTALLQEGDKNASISYNGDITKNDRIDAGDFGTADILFNAASNYADNSVANIEMRLAANINHLGQIVGEGESAKYWCGTIADIASIMDLAGSSLGG